MSIFALESERVGLGNSRAMICWAVARSTSLRAANRSQLLAKAICRASDNVNGLGISNDAKVITLVAASGAPWSIESRIASSA